MKVPALKVTQWLKLWDEVKYDSARFRGKPSEHFYLFSLKAKDLRLLSGIYPRSTEGRTRSSDDLGIQRRHDAKRSVEINEFVQWGHPWCDLSKQQRQSSEYDDLKKPGWLPTAIVINILTQNDSRAGKGVSSGDLIQVSSNKQGTLITLPSGFPAKDWRPSGIAPIEVIDGQHRLWAFDQSIIDGDFELPVVAFHGLDISWQAYLFYTINIKPKRINASLAFDLYPLLRSEDWLEKFEGPIVYRETRAQELVDLLYSHTDSPWSKRINMLGESKLGKRMVSQAAWVRSLIATFVKSWEGRGVSIGGLFGAPVGVHKQVLPWSRHEQAAFLIVAGSLFRKAVKAQNSKWAESLRDIDEVELFTNDDAAFEGSHTLIAQDQGVRAFLSVVNDLCYLNSDELSLGSWGEGGYAEGNDMEILSAAIASLKKTTIHEFLKQLGIELAKFDWRASGAPGLSQAESLQKAAFRGSGGYRDLRRQVLLHLAESTGSIQQSAKSAINLLGY